MGSGHCHSRSQNRTWLVEAPLSLVSMGSSRFREGLKGPVAETRHGSKGVTCRLDLSTPEKRLSVECRAVSTPAKGPPRRLGRPPKREVIDFVFMNVSMAISCFSPAFLVLDFSVFFQKPSGAQRRDMCKTRYPARLWCISSSTDPGPETGTKA